MSTFWHSPFLSALAFLLPGEKGAARNPKKPFSDLVWELNVRFYEEPIFTSIRDHLSRASEVSEDQIVNTLERLRGVSGDDAIRDYFLELARHVISTNHHLPSFLRY